MKNKILKLISELENRRKSHHDNAISARLAETDHYESLYTGRLLECDFLISMLWLLLKEEPAKDLPIIRCTTCGCIYENNECPRCAEG